MVAVTGPPVGDALADAEPAAFWPDRTPGLPRAALPGSESADLVVVGAGLTGLWTAVLAKQREPDLDVLVLEAGRAGSGGSARSGGFLSESLTHGLAHGAQLWPAEIGALAELGRRNLREIGEFVESEGIDADLRWCGKTAVATEPHQVGELRDEADLYREHGFSAVFQGAGGVRADLRSDSFRAGLRLPDAGGLVDPAKLVGGLVAAAERLGVRVHERSPVGSLRSHGGGLRLRCRQGTVRAGRAVLATNAFPALLRGLRRRVLPIWDYVLVTEPLSEAAWASLGWHDRQGVTDSHNLFHYFRPTPDGRILWGGGAAEYYFGGRTAPALAARPEPHRRLATTFFATFPQLAGTRFSHRWGGPIDATTRSTPVFGTALAGRVAYAAGFTGLGVAASRFGGQVALDLLAGEPTDRTRSALVRTRPLPYPPEPLRWPLVRFTHRALERADASAGERGPWLRLLDRHGLGLGS
ncbi:FAD-dependent oxidoreductase [Saccharopolyspora sp. NFXS83]|uniref:NAD(P)/FAD-dependent oxidoreductase n=1 Tax=Saccharopolyspora sp. NFXS83 TaxID=2993560 RepID=UPI00224B32B7|nr:FAD-dependent oxidoreductase [Saccharopolyspora sp. NFXS83]MCX2730032.1 FAD-dependent oxidoreductase [Saccharopolyspora sp. NFXS83]